MSFVVNRRGAFAVAVTSLALASGSLSRPVRADDAPLPARGADPAVEPAETTSPGSTTAGAAASTESILPVAPAEAPPPPPRKKGFVLEQSLGALGFIGRFRQVAPTAYWLRTQFGYEPLNWLMVFLSGELAFTDTSMLEDPTRTRAFAIFGFGAGARFTAHLTERFALFGQFDLGGMKADVASNALAVIGYRNAETLSAVVGGRIGLEWYQVNRHLALGVLGGLRSASGFKKDTAQDDSALLWDAAATLRYTF